MHYYKRNLGDYAKKTGRLTMLQHGAYNLLLDACYDRERFPTEAEAIEWAWASTEAEIEAVKFVLSRFFTLQDGRYVQSRIQEEIEHYQSIAATNARIANERETKRRQNSTKRARSVHEAPPNQEPRTTNQEPDKGEQLTHTGEGAADPGALAATDHHAFFAQEKPPAVPVEPMTDAPPSPAGKICRAMRLAKLASVNPGDPRFLALLAQGATEAEFVGLAEEAVKKEKGWPWVLATLEGRRRDAAAISLKQAAPRPQTQRERQGATTAVLLGMTSRQRSASFDFDLDAQGDLHAKQISQ